MKSLPLTRRRALQTLFCSSAALALNLRSGPARAAAAADALHLFAIGDFGTSGKHQRAVSQAMQRFLTEQELRLEALLLLGDNFYGREKDGFTIDSPRWRIGFEEMYPAAEFDCPCYAVLGNHDYDDNPGGEEVQLAYARRPDTRWRMPARWYRLDLGDPPRLTILALDSNLPQDSAEEHAEQLAWLRAELEQPRAPLTLAIGHHPVYSNGAHGDTRRLVKEWAPLFREHRVHAYLCGHDHDLQHLELEGEFTSYVISGAGGASLRKLRGDHPAPFGRDVYGFTHVQALPQALVFAHHGVDGALLHRFAKYADGRVEIG